MIDRSEAEEHLRVIRSLMEKATIYRAISAEAAAVAGAIALLTAFAVPSFPFGGYGFTIKWLGALVLCSAANLHFLSRDARRRGDPFLSAGMRMALAAMSAPLLCGGAFTLFFAQGSTATPFWMMCYGLALTSTSAFAPRSIVFLGWAFVIASLVTFVVSLLHGMLAPALTADLWMAGTFGLFHMIYAVCTWPRRAR